MGRLTTEEVEQYERDGVIHVPAALGLEWSAPMRAAVERVIEPRKSFGLTHRVWADDGEFRSFATETGLANSPPKQRAPTPFGSTSTRSS